MITYLKQNHLSLLIILWIIVSAFMGASGDPAFGARRDNLTTVDNPWKFTGTFEASSTAQVTGAATFYSTAAITATTSLTGNLMIGTSTPGQTITAGQVFIDTPAIQNSTTTLYITSGHGTKGGCIQLEGPASTTFRLYATTSGLVYVDEGTCR